MTFFSSSNLNSFKISFSMSIKNGCICKQSLITYLNIVKLMFYSFSSSLWTAALIYEVMVFCCLIC